jgi:hypothetical protein
MQAVRRFFIVVTTIVSAPLLYFSGMFLFVLSFNLYPFGALLLPLWVFGALGAVGLLLSWQDAAAKSALRLRIDLTLLCQIAGARVAGL